MTPKGPQDFYTGLLFTAVGLFFFVSGYGLEFGDVTNMGPGFLPKVISIILIAVGVFQSIRGLKAQGKGVDFSFKEPVIIGLSLLAFGYCLDKVGAIISILGLMLVTAILHKKFTWWQFILSYVVVVVAILLFKFGLGSTIPL
jgi:Tripartite tricarboxylate transporter TctB family